MPELLWESSWKVNPTILVILSGYFQRLFQKKKHSILQSTPVFESWLREVKCASIFEASSVRESPERETPNPIVLASHNVRFYISEFQNLNVKKGGLGAVCPRVSMYVTMLKPSYIMYLAVFRTKPILRWRRKKNEEDEDEEDEYEDEDV